MKTHSQKEAKREGQPSEGCNPCPQSQNGANADGHFPERNSGPNESGVLDEMGNQKPNRAAGGSGH